MDLPGHEDRWDTHFFRQIGLEDLLENDAQIIGCEIRPDGVSRSVTVWTPKRSGRSGLIPGTPVATSIIDAHAGGIGVGCRRCHRRTTTDFKHRWR